MLQVVSAMQGGRNVSIDVAKGVGILLVVLGHTCLSENHLIYAFHMPLFFFLAGVCFNAERHRDVWAFARLRARQLLLPTLVVVAVCCLCHALVGKPVPVPRPSNQWALVDTWWFPLTLWLAAVAYHPIAARCRKVVALEVAVALFALALALILPTHTPLNISGSQWPWPSTLLVTFSASRC